MGTGEFEEFPLYYDSDVGLADKWISDLQIEARMDDDVDTDDEIYRNAQNAIRNDCKETQSDLRKYKYNWSMFVNNCEIQSRVQRPGCYDRNGKYREPSKRNSRFSTEVTEQSRSALV